jgi:hypothetical protein
MRLRCRPPVFEPQVPRRLIVIYPIYQYFCGCQLDHYVLTTSVPIQALVSILINLLVNNHLAKNFMLCKFYFRGQHTLLPLSSVIGSYVQDQLRVSFFLSKYGCPIGDLWTCFTIVLMELL